MARDELEELLSIPDLDEKIETNAFFLLAETYRELGNTRLALTHARVAWDLAKQVKTPGLEAKTLNTLGNIHDDRGEHDQALDCYEAANALLNDSNDTRGQGRILRNIGTTLDRLGETGKAITAMQRGVEIAHTHGDLHGLASGLVSLSRLYTTKKQYVLLNIQTLDLQTPLTLACTRNTDWI